MRKFMDKPQTMNAGKTFPVEGGCACRFVRYRMTSKPLFVHCCHCTWCQRETGTAFALNAMIEADRDAVRFVRVGTLDEAGRFPPDIHIFTSTKLSWVVLPQGAQAVPEFYKISERWPNESLQRRAALMAARQKS
jgi:hypothetical protein